MPRGFAVEITLAMMGVLWFGLGSLLTFVAWFGFAIFQVGHVVGAWRGGLFLCVLALVATFLLVVGFGLGAALAKKFPARGESILLGALAASAFGALIWLASQARVSSDVSWALGFTLPFLGGLAPFLARKRTDG